MVEFGLIFYGLIAVLSAFALGTDTERGDAAQATLVLLWAALWPLSIAFGLGVLFKHLTRRRSA